MKPVTHILVPINFSETSLRALKYGLFVKEAFSAELTLSHVVVHPVDEGAVEEAERRLEALVPKPLRSGTRVRVSAVDCSIEEELLRNVGESAADLVVLGTRGSSFKRFLQGSTTDRLVRRLPVPLLTVCKTNESGKTPLETVPQIRRVLYLADFSDSIEIALPLAIGFARRFQAELEMVHVVEHVRRSPTSPPYTDEELTAEQRVLNRSAEELLQRIVSGAGVGDLAVKVTVLEGRAYDAILAHVADSQTDLVVASLHRMTRLERALLGATAERVIRAAAVPALGVPSSALFRKSSSGTPGYGPFTGKGAN